MESAVRQNRAMENKAPSSAAPGCAATAGAIRRGDTREESGSTVTLAVRLESRGISTERVPDAPDRRGGFPAGLCLKWRMGRVSLLAVCSALALPAVQADLIQEIIVTAQKREEMIQDVPMAITAYSGENLDELGVVNLTDVGRFASGVEMLNADSSQPNYSIRGVQTFDFTAGSDSTVAVYVDGIYATRDAGAEIPLTDIERVEILKGPQGTLFGRNAIGGAIHIITREPSAEQEGSLQLTAGNYARQNLAFAWNQPVGEHLAVRLGGASYRRDGWMANVAGSDQNQEDNRSLRVALGWIPSEDLKLVWRASYDDRNQFSGAIPSITDAIARFETPPRQRASAFDDVGIDGRNAEERDLFNTSLQMTREFEHLTFTAITGWRSFNTDFWQDEDGSANVDYTFNSLNRTADDQFSQEFRLNGSTDALKWTAGAVYSREHIDRLTLAEFRNTTLETFALWEGTKAQLVPLGMTESEIAELLPYLRAANRANGIDGIAIASFVAQLIEPCGAGVPADVCAGLILPLVQQELLSPVPWTETVRNTGTFESTAVYGDLTWNLSERLALSAGLRYTLDEKTFTIFTRYQNSFAGVPLGIAFFNNGNPVLDSRQREDWDALSGRLVLDYRVNEDVLAYASVATGFKSGGFNSLNFGPGIQTSYDSETLVNYELGVKGDYLDGRLRLNGAAYFYRYDDLQELDLVGVPIPSYNIRNADAEGSGLDLDFIWVASERLTLLGNYSYLDTEYTDYRIIPAVGETEADDKTGEPRSGTPRNKLNLALVYNQPLDRLGSIAYRLDYFYNGDRLSGRVDVAEQDPARIVRSYDLWNGRISWLSANAGLEVAVWGQNLLDEEIIADFGNIGQAIGSVAAWPLPPRMLGVDLTWNF